MNLSYKSDDKRLPILCLFLLNYVYSKFAPKGLGREINSNTPQLTLSSHIGF